MKPTFKNKNASSPSLDIEVMHQRIIALRQGIYVFDIGKGGRHSVIIALQGSLDKLYVL